MHRHRVHAFVACSLFLFLIPSCSLTLRGIPRSEAFAAASPTPAFKSTVLDEYVAAPDDAFAWKLISSKEFHPLSSLGPRVTSHHMSLTSQRWLNSTITSCSLWTHDVIINVPENAVITSKLAALFIGSGTLGMTEDEVYQIPETSVAQTFSAITDMVTVTLNQVPNQRCTYASDPQGVDRIEDANVAFTFKKFFDEHRAGNAEEANRWPIFLPAVKAVVRAMDAASEFLSGGCKDATTGASDCAALHFPSKEDSRWLVTGASKRGWTTWLTAAVDKRVYGIVPIVYPLMDLRKSIASMYSTYGHWQIIAQDYVENGFMCNLYTDDGGKLLDIIDPLTYISRLSMPILMVSGADDEFFHPDIISVWFGDSLTPKVDFPRPKDVHVATIPNADHPLGTIGSAQAVATFVSFARMLANQILAEEDVLPSLLPPARGSLPGDAVDASFKRPVFDWWTDRAKGTIQAFIDTSEQTELPHAVYQHYALSVNERNDTQSSPSATHSMRRDYRWFGVCPGAPDTAPTEVCQQQVWWFTRELKPVTLNATTIMYETESIADGRLWSRLGDSDGFRDAENRYRATYIDMHFPSPQNYANSYLFKLRKTTTVLILPEVFPGTEHPTRDMLCTSTYI